MTNALEPEITEHSHAHGAWQLWRWGPPAGDQCTESLVLLHAAASHPQTFQRLVGHLLAKGREILAPALNGYGTSQVAHALGPVARHVAIAKAALDATTQPARTSLFGHSMGGLVALLTALEAPALERLVLYDPIVTGILDPKNPAHRAGLEWDRAIIRALCEGVEGDAPEVGVARFVEAWNEARWAELPTAIRETLVSKAPALALDAPAVSYFEFEPVRLATLQMQTTVAYGERSPEIIALIARQLAARHPGFVSAKALADCGHMAPIAQPAKVASVLAGALR